MLAAALVIVGIQIFFTSFLLSASSACAGAAEPAPPARALDVLRRDAAAWVGAPARASAVDRARRRPARRAPAPAAAERGGAAAARHRARSMCGLLRRSTRSGCTAGWPRSCSPRPPSRAACSRRGRACASGCGPGPAARGGRSSRCSYLAPSLLSGALDLVRLQLPQRHVGRSSSSPTRSSTTARASSRASSPTRGASIEALRRVGLPAGDARGGRDVRDARWRRASTSSTRATWRCSRPRPRRALTGVGAAQRARPARSRRWPARRAVGEPDLPLRAAGLDQGGRRVHVPATVTLLRPRAAALGDARRARRSRSASRRRR